MSIIIGHHDNGTTIQPFYTGLKTKAAAKRAAAYRFGEGAISMTACECADREILSQVAYMELTLSERTKEVRFPMYIQPHRNEQHGTQLEREVSQLAEDSGISESEAYDRIRAGYDMTGIEREYDHMANVPF